MPFGKYLEAREMLSQSETPSSTEEARPVDLLAQLPKDAPVTLRELSVRTGLSVDDLRERLNPLERAGLVEIMSWEGEDAARPTETGKLAL